MAEIVEVNQGGNAEGQWVDKDLAIDNAEAEFHRNDTHGGTNSLFTLTGQWRSQTQVQYAHFVPLVTSKNDGHYYKAVGLTWAEIGHEHEGPIFPFADDKGDYHDAKVFIVQPDGSEQQIEVKRIYAEPPKVGKFGEPLFSGQA